MKNIKAKDKINNDLSSFREFFNLLKSKFKEIFGQFCFLKNKYEIIRKIACKKRTLKGFIPLNKDKISRFKIISAIKEIKIITTLLKIEAIKYEENKFNKIAKNNITKILQKFY